MITVSCRTPTLAHYEGSHRNSGAVSHHGLSLERFARFGAGGLLASRRFERRDGGVPGGLFPLGEPWWEIGVRTASATAPNPGSLNEKVTFGLQVCRSWPARAGVASTYPLPRPDAKTPHFRRIFSSRTRARSHRSRTDATPRRHLHCLQDARAQQHFHMPAAREQSSSRAEEQCTLATMAGGVDVAPCEVPARTTTDEPETDDETE